MPLDTIGILGGFNLRALGGHTDGSSMYVPTCFRGRIAVRLPRLEEISPGWPS